MRQRTSGERFIIALAIPVFAVVVFFVVLPMLLTAAESTMGEGISVNYASFLSGSTQRALFLSVGISVASVVFAGVIGTVLAVLLNRFDFPGRRWLEVFAVLPMALPPLIGSVAFVLLVSTTGIIPRTLALVGFRPADVAFTGVAGVLLVHAFTQYPYFYLSVSAGLAGMDPSLEEASSSLGAPRWRVWVDVVLPMLTPALVAGSLMTFMTAMASFTAPQLFNVQTLTMQIVSTRTIGNYPLAAAQSTVLGVVSIVFLLAMRWYQARRIHRSLSKGIQRSRTRTSGLASLLAAAGSIVLSLVLLAPIATIFLVSFSVDNKWTTQILPTHYTIQNYVNVFSDPSLFLPVNVSLQMAFFATLAAVVIGAAAAWIIARWPLKGKALLDIFIMLPWALPGTVIGINLVTAFAQPTTWNLGLVLVGSVMILPVAYFVRYVPLVFRNTAATIDQLDPSIDEAAQSLGASPIRSLLTIVMPLVAKGILAGALLAFVDGVGEYVASVIIFPAGYPPMSVAIYQMVYASQFGTAAAYGSLQIALIFVVLTVLNGLESGSEKRRRKTVVAATPRGVQLTPTPGAAS